jgi:hypothetical protein
VRTGPGGQLQDLMAAASRRVSQQRVANREVAVLEIHLDDVFEVLPQRATRAALPRALAQGTGSLPACGRA